MVGTASAAKHEFVRSLGADELIDHQMCDFAAVVGDLDVVLDSLGGEIARRSISVLRPGGMLVTIVGRRDVDLAARTRASGPRFAGLSVEPDYPGLEALAGLVRLANGAGSLADVCHVKWWAGAGDACSWLCAAAILVQCRPAVDPPPGSPASAGVSAARRGSR